MTDASAFGWLVHQSPPLIQLALIGLPLGVFVSWGPWSWVAGLAAGAWAATWGGLDGFLLAALVVGALAYVANCRWNAYADCWWCKGSPKRRDSRKHYHFCLICGGNGRRTRLGAYAWKKYRDAR